jgi:2,4-dienoyl-CoA reductase-like NADH-dependent reductase (Old Yellow Enzyme family)
VYRKALSEKTAATGSTAIASSKIAGFSEMTEAVHKSSGKIVMQLAHAGIQANSSLTSQLWDHLPLKKFRRSRNEP